MTTYRLTDIREYDQDTPFITDPRDRSIFDLYARACCIINDGIDPLDTYYAGEIVSVKNLLQQFASSTADFDGFCIESDQNCKNIIVDKDALARAVDGIEHEMWLTAAEKYLDNVALRPYYRVHDSSYWYNMALAGMHYQPDKMKHAMIELGLTEKQADLLADYEKAIPIIALKQYSKNIALRNCVDPDKISSTVMSLMDEVNASENFRSMLNSHGFASDIDNGFITEFIDKCNHYSDSNKQTQFYSSYRFAPESTQEDIAKVYLRAKGLMKQYAMLEEDLRDVLGVKEQLRCLSEHKKLGDGFIAEVAYSSLLTISKETLAELVAALNDEIQKCAVKAYLQESLTRRPGQHDWYRAGEYLFICEKDMARKTMLDLGFTEQQADLTLKCVEAISMLKLDLGNGQLTHDELINTLGPIMDSDALTQSINDFLQEMASDKTFKGHFKSDWRARSWEEDHRSPIYALQNVCKECSDAFEQDQEIDYPEIDR